ncbi:unnamed protein product [Soboliphyme baturini]|uniref:DDE_Tnp_1_7 domain-containing protein n=1 Tax=Soboliphyme baturini TaxID=241478 RepID=A0A183J4B5_9BILA|nr:unnamed protein product [Soboliphyme baturini]
MFDVSDGCSMDQKIARLVAEAEGVSSNGDYHSCNKNLLKIRKQISNEFCKNVLFKRPRRCPQCSVFVPNLRHEYKRSIMAKFPEDKSKKSTRQTTKIKDKAAMIDLQFEVTSPDTSATFIDTPKELEVTESIGGYQFLAPSQVMEHFRQVWLNGGQKMLTAVFPFLNASEMTANNSTPTDLLFCTNILVSPSKFRPLSVYMGRQFENPQTLNLRRVLENCALMRHLLKICLSETGKLVDADQLFLSQIPGSTPASKYLRIYSYLQSSVNLLYDSDLDPLLSRYTF